MFQNQSFLHHRSEERRVGKENKVVTGVIWQQLLLFFFPILFGTFFQQLYNAADAVIVGRFVGKEAPVSYTHLSPAKMSSWMTVYLK